MKKIDHRLLTEILLCHLLTQEKVSKRKKSKKSRDQVPYLFSKELHTLLKDSNEQMRQITKRNKQSC